MVLMMEVNGWNSAIPCSQRTPNPQMGCLERETSDRHMSWHRFGYAAERRNLTSSGTIPSGAGPWS